MSLPRTGAILRRGTGGLTNQHFKELLDNADKVDEIIAEIEARRAVYIETEAAAKARVDEAVKAEADLATREAALADALVDLEAREKAVALGKKALTDFLDWSAANPISPVEET